MNVLTALIALSLMPIPVRFVVHGQRYECSAWKLVAAVERRSNIEGVVLYRNEVDLHDGVPTISLRMHGPTLRVRGRVVRVRWGSTHRETVKQVLRAVKRWKRS